MKRKHQFVGVMRGVFTENTFISEKLIQGIFTRMSNILH